MCFEKIEEILHGMIQNNNWKFNHPPNRIKSALEQLSAKSVAKFNKDYENTPAPTAWNFANKNVGNSGNGDRWGTNLVTTDVTTSIQVERKEYTRERIEKLEKAIELLQKKQEDTAKTADIAMSKIDQVQLIADVARTTAIAAKEKATKVEKQIKDLVLDNNTKFVANMGETANLKIMMKQQNDDMNTKLDTNMTEMKTKPSRSYVSMLISIS